MAIIQISKIQHRRGKQENLPQLSAGELGWAIDSRRLFIGNGSTAEGAPPATLSPNVTEILTQYSVSTLLSSLPLYTYIGNTGNTVQTGPSALTPTTRTVQQRLDDTVSVKAFGAKGDGVTDDGAAIARALYQLYVADTSGLKRSIFFPAGTYIISGVLNLPRGARLTGEGIDRTIIKQTDGTKTSVFKTADSLGQVHPNLGLNGATMPGLYDIEMMTLQHVNKAQNIIELDSTVGFVAHEVKFKNTWAAGDGGATGAQAIAVTSSATVTSDLYFTLCEFEGVEYVNKLDYDVKNVLFQSCKTTTAYAGHWLGQNLTGVAPQSVGPQGYRIVGSDFDNVTAQAIRGYTYVKGVISADNVYRDVGNNNAGISSPVTSVIKFVDADNQSVSDYFARTSSESIPNIEIVNSNSIAFANGQGLLLNNFHTAVSAKQTLSGGAAALDSNISFNTNYSKAIEIFYHIVRDANDRTGKIRITMTSSGQVLTDDYDENNAATGITFSLGYIAPTVTLKYTSTVGNAATMTYVIKQLR